VEKKENLFSMKVTVPVGCNATVYVQASKNQNVTENAKELANSEFIKVVGEEEGYKIFSFYQWKV